MISESELFNTIFQKYSDKGPQEVMKQFLEYKELFCNETPSAPTPPIVQDVASLTEETYADKVERCRSMLKKEYANDIGPEYVLCRICGEKFNMLTKKHFKKHGIDKSTYLDACGYPKNKALVSQSISDKRKESIITNQIWNKKKSKNIGASSESNTTEATTPTPATPENTKTKKTNKESTLKE